MALMVSERREAGGSDSRCAGSDARAQRAQRGEKYRRHAMSATLTVIPQKIDLGASRITVQDGVAPVKRHSDRASVGSEIEIPRVIDGWRRSSEYAANTPYPTPYSGTTNRTSGAFLTVPVTSDESARSKRRVWQALSPIHRALLATDGSFTLLLQALAGEEICVETLLQTVKPTPNADERLALSAGEDIMTRGVLLHTSSGRKLVYAQSRIVPHRLSRLIVDELQASMVSIGLLLRRARLESFRELIDWGECELSNEGCGQLIEKRCIFRCYAIISGGWPVMEVSEFFLPTLFEGMS
jgi:chorismate-pyruvate lyase